MGKEPETSEFFEETSEIPPGKAPRIVVEDRVWRALEKSAANGTGFTRTDTPEVIAGIRSQLTSGAVKAKYEVRTKVTHSDDGKDTLKFAAKPKAAPVE